MEMSNLYDYLLHYNHYTQTWFAIPRQNISNYWNGDMEGVLKSKEIKTLIELITRGKEFIEKIK